jgi:hypothetical protein
MPTFQQPEGDEYSFHKSKRLGLLTSKLEANSGYSSLASAICVSDRSSPTQVLIQNAGTLEIDIREKRATDKSQR